MKSELRSNAAALASSEHPGAIILSKVSASLPPLPLALVVFLKKISSFLPIFLFLFSQLIKGEKVERAAGRKRPLGKGDEEEQAQEEAETVTVAAAQPATKKKKK